MKNVNYNNINYQHKLNKPVKYVCITNNDWLIAYRIYKRNIEWGKTRWLRATTRRPEARAWRREDPPPSSVLHSCHILGRWRQLTPATEHINQPYILPARNSIIYVDNRFSEILI